MFKYKRPLITSLALLILAGCATQGSLAPNHANFQPTLQCAASLYVFINADAALSLRVAQSLRNTKFSEDQDGLVKKKMDEHPSAGDVLSLVKLVGAGSIKGSLQSFVKEQQPYKAYEDSLKTHGDFIVALEETLPVFQSTAASKCKEAGYGFRIKSLSEFNVEQRQQKLLTSSTLEEIQAYIDTHKPSEFRTRLEGKLEFLSWEKVSESQSVTVVEDFIGRFPESVFRRKANERLEYLKLMELSSVDDILNLLATNKQFSEKARSEALTKVRQLLEPKLSSLINVGKCLEADAALSPLNKLDHKLFKFDLVECQNGFEFRTMMASEDPNQKYLYAVKMERAGRSDQAQKIYKDIMERFPKHTLAIKASDRLLAIDEKEEREYRASRESTERDHREIRERLRRASEEARQKEEEAINRRIQRSACQSFRQTCLNACTSSRCKAGCPPCP